MKSTSRTRRLLGGATAALVLSPVAVVAAAPIAAADRTYYVPVTKSWTISGHGYGHGRGMSQYGAQGAAAQGLTYAEILAFYYPGTAFANSGGRVRVLLSSDTTPDLQVRPHRGLKVRELRDGVSWRLPASPGLDKWRLTPASDGPTVVQYHNGKGWHRWAIPDGRAAIRSDAEFVAHGPLTLLVPGSSHLTAKRYRGSLRLARPYPGASTRDTVNVVSLDGYVQGVVPNEMPASWMTPALRAQAVAARTYAAWQRSRNPDRYYQICDTTACQVYGGVAAEQTPTNSAVQATARRIITYRGTPAFTEFSASSGGWTARGSASYLPASKDPYDDFAANPVHDWTQTVSASSLERSYPEIGRLIDVVVTRRDGHGSWNGRVEQLVLEGKSGTAYLTGDDFRFRYGLRSTWFTIAPTPIIERWRAIGGRRANVGTPVSGEYAVSTGSAQKFTSGRIYWSPRHGAREVKGPILKAYLHWGGPASNLRWPVAGVTRSPAGGHKVKFVHGMIYTAPSTGPQVIYGRILDRWSRAGGARSDFGYPTTDVFTIDGGLRVQFQHGVISWDRSSDTFSVTHY